MDDCECWVAAGFVPRDDSERERFDALQSDLGFDPTEHADRLDARLGTAKRSAKRVLLVLSHGDAEREAWCWRDASLAELRRRGGYSGLAAFLAEVAAKVAPLLQRGRA